jgi:transcriptional regulator with XRE-family HTH domain
VRINGTSDLDIERMQTIVARQLKAGREFRNLSVRKAAAKLDISPSYLSQMESGERRVSLEVLFSASKLYRISVSALLGREEIPGHRRGKRILEVISRFFDSPIPSH